MDYPHVLPEHQTLARLLAGASLARYGDGEFNLCRLRLGIPCQRFDENLSDALRAILVKSTCDVGIPNMDPRSPKARLWEKYRYFSKFLTDRPYVSAFVSRPDSAPWIDTPDYWADVQRLWTDRDVTLVRGSTRSLTAADLDGASSVVEVIGPPVDAWADYGRLLDEASDDPDRLVLLCLGPTATVLAHDLCEMGLQAIDLGHLGMFRRKHVNGQPMKITEADRAAGMVPRTRLACV